MRLLMSILLIVAVSSPLAFAKQGSGKVAKTSSSLSSTIIGDNPGSDCSHSKKKINARHSDTNPKEKVIAEALGAGSASQVQ